MPTKQYNKISGDYSKYVNIDPSKQYVHYSEALRLLGNLKGKIILDVGCGNGIFTRTLARKGAKVIAYDISKKQIQLAKKSEKKTPLGIRYFVANPSNIKKILKENLKFDLAVSVLVLLYAKNEKELGEFFLSTSNLLKPQGKFISITFNPNYKRLGISAYNRIFSQEGEISSNCLLDNEILLIALAII